jgi:hypothetical protein
MSKTHQTHVVKVWMEKKRHKIESNKFSKPPKTRSKNTRPIYLLFYKVCGRRERERESNKFSKPSKTRRKKPPDP